MFVLTKCTRIANGKDFALSKTVGAEE